MADIRKAAQQAPSECARTAPKRIWLQVSDDAEDLGNPYPHNSEVTWCQDSVLACEVEYVRADLSQPAAQPAEAQGEPVAPRAFRIPEAGTPWWQTAKDCGAWTDRQDGDVGYVHFGSVEALRVYTMKVCRQAEAAAVAARPAAQPVQVPEGWVAEAKKHAAKCQSLATKLYNEAPGDPHLEVSAGAALQYAVQLMMAVAAAPLPPAQPKPVFDADALITDFCGKWSAADQVKAGDVLDWLMARPVSQQAAQQVGREPLTDEQAHLCRQWFEVVMDVNPTYLEPLDYQFALSLYERLKIRPSNAVRERAHGITGEGV